MNTSFLRPALRASVAGALLLACEPSVPQQASPPSVVTAVFDPLSAQIPLPNDLALLTAGSTATAQGELLNAFVAQKGFPNDQEVPVTISFTRQNIAASGAVTSVAPILDLATLTPATLVVALATPQGAGPVALDPVAATDYTTTATQGTLTLHHKGRQPWAPGEYVVAVRGGPNGVKTREGDPVYASQVFYLIAQGQSLNTEQNLALLRAQAGSTAAAQALALQLDAIIDGYKQGGAFAAVNQVFPQQELAALTTFAIAPLRTQVQLDAGRGLVPLPIDLLRDPRPASATCPACGHLTPLAACTLAQGNFNAATGACTDSKGNPNPAAAGFATLDGFSTTGLILAPTSDLVQAATINAATVQLYDLSNTAAPVDTASYLHEPCEVTSSCSDHVNALSPVIALQPAGATSYDNQVSPIPSVFRTRPLRDNADYAVVISDGVKDKAGNSLAAGTAARILQFRNALVDAGGHSLLAGVDDLTAGALEVMRQKLAPVLLSAASHGIAQGHVAMAYTFHTQSITGTAAQLAALPYLTPSSGANSTIQPASVVVHCNGSTNSNPACDAANVATTFSAYGIPAPRSNVGYLIEAVIPTFNKLRCNAGDTTCKDTGAFSGPAVQPVVEPIRALIALPAPPYGSCTPAAGAPCTLPLLIFRHGLAGGRAQMLALADSFNAQGIAVAAIDAAKHGDRSYCSADNQCAAGAHCVADPALAGEGDAPNPTPGQCRTGTTPASPLADFARSTACGSCTNTQAVPFASANFLISSNFFRTRDTLRQDIIDQSQLLRVLSPDPTGAQPGNNLTTALTGVQFDPGRIWFAGQSLGAIQGTVDVAANPRISKAVLNVGGGPVVDLFTNSPAFASVTNQLLASLGILPGANSAYLQFLVVAKTILDPADPVNFAGHLTANTLPNLLANPNGTVAQAAKGVLTQAAYCDQVVPNPFNYLLDSTAVGLSQMPGFTAGTGTFELFYKGTSAPDITTCPSPTSGAAPPATAVTHGFLLDFVDPTITVQAQADVAAFLSAGTKPPTVRVLP